MKTKIMLGLLFSAAVFSSSGCTRTVVVERPIGVPETGMDGGYGGAGNGGGSGGGSGGQSANGGRNGGGSNGQYGGSGNGRNGNGRNGNGGGNGGGANGGGAHGGGSGGQYGNGRNGGGSGQYGANGGGSGGQYGGRAGGANGGGQYTPADLQDPASILAQRIIYFDYDQSQIRPEYQKILDAHSSLLSAYPNLHIRLEGHADERGSREYNVALSERRGYSVLDYMTIKGTNAQQAEVVGYGEEVPVTFGHENGAWSKNRRVEIIYSGE